MSDDRLDKENKKFRDFGSNTMVNTNTVLDVSLSEIRIENDVNGNVIYLGWAAVGSAESSSVWLIAKLNYDVNGNINERVWADGEEVFNKIWDDRATYNYSY